MNSTNRKRSSAITFFLLMMSLMHLPSGAVEQSTWPYADESTQQRDARMQWWRDARFGMFIHWGVYAVPAGTYNGYRVNGIGEWIMNRGKIPVAEYKEYAEAFNPVKYDPEAWVKLAKEAGMKYIVITAKHHDGFALFDSAVTDWDVVDATPYGKDLLKPLAEACRKHGIKLGFYYSQAQDWCHPGGAASRKAAKDGWNNPDAEKIDAYTAEHRGQWDPAQEGDMDEYIKNIAAPQVKEILTNYGDIAVLWWDTPTNMNKERADMLQPLITLQPGIITNNRLGGGYPGDTETPEQYIPATGFKDRDWETCMTMNDTWGFKSYDDNWKSTETLLRNLVDIASKGGNYLLNIGPTAEGEIPQPSIERLKEIGQWMDVNGESIYGTTASPFAKLTWGRCTKKIDKDGTTLYLHVFDWPADGKLLVPGLQNKAEKARLLATGKSLKTVSGSDGLTIHVPDEPLDEIDTVIELHVKGPIDIQKVVPKQDAAGTVTLPAILANIHNHLRGQAKLEEKQGTMNIGYWTSPEVTVDWEFVIDRPGTFKILADTAAPADTHLAVRVEGQTLQGQAASTGDYGSFRQQSLGRVTFTTAGEKKIELIPVKDKWKPLNVRALRLVPTESEAQKGARMQWWRDARFGMFIHWGIYAVPAGEWDGKTEYGEWILHNAKIPLETYETFTDQFNPVEFDADAWVRMAKDAGMKYMVITSKHHDGFCLWDSAVTDYDVVDSTPYGRDILEALAKACRKHDLTLGFYYSIMDWHHPDYLPRRDWEDRSAEGADYQRYIAYMKTQLKELVTRFDPAILWFDGEWEHTWTHEEGQKLYDYVRSLKPDIIINNRVDKGRQGMEGTYDPDKFAGDFGTPEQEIPATGLDIDWESCMTMNWHWGWNKHDKAFKTTEDLVRKLVDIASKGGNFLLNIGPKADGTFPEESVDRLAGIGDWMKDNAESIYGTSPSPFADLPWGRCTKKDGPKTTTLYLHVFDWPADGKLVVPGLRNQPSKARLLAGGKALKTVSGSDGLTIMLPDKPVDPVDTVVKLTIKGQLKIDTPDEK